MQLGEGAGALAPTVAQDPGNSQPGIVVEDALRHSPQESEGRDVPVQEGLGGLGRVSLDVASVAVGHVDYEAVGLLLHPADDQQGHAEVALGVARRMGQGDEHLPGLAAVLPHVVLDDGVLAIKPVLVPEPLEDALGGVALLLGDLMILIQDVVDDSGEGLQLGASGGVCRR